MVSIMSVFGFILGVVVSVVVFELSGRVSSSIVLIGGVFVGVVSGLMFAFATKLYERVQYNRE